MINAIETPVQEESKEAIGLQKSQEEVNHWLMSKRLTPSERETQKDNIEKLVEAVRFGHLTISESRVMTYTLAVPILDKTDQVFADKLTFQPRMNVKTISERTKSVKPSDVDGRYVAYISALTGQATGIIENLDSRDYAFCQAVVSFFL